MIAEHTSTKERVFATKGSRTAVYETYQDALDDIANIPDNTVVYTKDSDPLEVSWGEKQTIAAATFISGWTAPSDGLVFIDGNGSTTSPLFGVKRNGESVDFSHGLGGTVASTILATSQTLPVYKGDVLSCTGSASQIHLVEFYPFKVQRVDYSMLQMTWEDPVIVTGIEAVNSKWTAPKAGLFYVNKLSVSQSYARFRITRNGTQIDLDYTLNSANNVGTSLCIPVLGGDTITCLQLTSGKVDSCSFVGLTSTKKNSVGLPIGSVTAFMGSTAPSGWLVCDGSTYDTAVYPGLYEVLQSNTLPDMREAALVGIGTRGTGVATHDTFTLGQFKDDALQQHQHYRYSGNRNGWNVGMPSSGAVTGYVATNSYNYNNGEYIGNMSSGRAASVTRGKRFGVNYIIKARD